MSDRRNSLKWVLTLSTALGLIVLIAVFIQFRRQQGQYVAVMPDMATEALMRLVRLHQTATKDGRLQWELDAETAQLEAASGRMILQVPVVVFYTDDGDSVYLTADQGTLDTKTNDMTVVGNVRLRNSRYQLETEGLTYHHDQQILHADQPIRIEGGAIGLRADTMVYALETNQAVFDGHVEGNLNADMAIR